MQHNSTIWQLIEGLRGLEAKTRAQRDEDVARIPPGGTPILEGSGDVDGTATNAQRKLSIIRWERRNVLQNIERMDKVEFLKKCAASDRGRTVQRHKLLRRRFYDIGSEDIRFDDVRFEDIRFDDVRCHGHWLLQTLVIILILFKLYSGKWHLPFRKFNCVLFLKCFLCFIQLNNLGDGARC